MTNQVQNKSFLHKQAENVKNITSKTSEFVGKKITSLHDSCVHLCENLDAKYCINNKFLHLENKFRKLCEPLQNSLVVRKLNDFFVCSENKFKNKINQLTELVSNMKMKIQLLKNEIKSYIQYLKNELREYQQESKEYRSFLERKNNSTFSSAEKEEG